MYLKSYLELVECLKWTIEIKWNLRGYKISLDYLNTNVLGSGFFFRFLFFWKKMKQYKTT